MLIVVLMLCSFAVATAEFVLVGLLPEIAADLAVSVPAAGQLVTVYMLVVTVGGPVATVLTRRMPRRSLLAATMALATGAAALASVADSYAVLLVARLGSAVAQALFMAVASQVAMAAVPAQRQTAAVARVFGGFALATVIGLPVSSLVGQAYGWHAGSSSSRCWPEPGSSVSWSSARASRRPKAVTPTASVALSGWWPTGPCSRGSL